MNHRHALQLGTMLALHFLLAMDDPDACATSCLHSVHSVRHQGERTFCLQQILEDPLGLSC